MPEDVSSALDRFQTFAESFSGGAIINENSGFTVADAQLLIGEIIMAAHREGGDASPID